ncbi:MAG: MoaD/ThiS family protein [Candidatus Thorarchaeota archaeon]|nr:MoaD/ThiS family protein [Candidatus Thorarchaeota archaeon]
MRFIKDSLEEREWRGIMKLTIKFRGPIARQFKEGILVIDIEDGVSINQLLVMLLDQNPNLQRIWNEPSDVDRDTMILRNEVDIGVIEGLDSILEDADVLTVLPLVHGG